MDQLDQLLDTYSEAEIRREAKRYLFVRRLNVRQWRQLWQANVSGIARFDDLVDRAMHDHFTAGLRVDEAVAKACQ